MAERYRTRPTPVEAARWIGGALEASHIIDWVLGNDGTARYHEAQGPSEIDAGWSGRQREHVVVDRRRHRDGDAYLYPGDWLVLGAEGFAVCKPAEFAERYEPLVSDG